MSEETPAGQNGTPSELTIWVDGERVEIRGTRSADGAVRRIFAAAGFTWSRPRTAWVPRRNLRPVSRLRAIEQVTDALRALERPVLIQDSGTDQSAQQRRTAGEDRLRTRAARLEQRVEGAQASSEHSRAVAERIWAGYAGGPILEDHYSAPRHRRDLERADRSLRAALDAQTAAQEQARLARQIREHQQRGEHPLTLKRRLQAKRRTLSSIQRTLAQAGAPGADEALHAEAALLAQEIALDEGVLADLVARGETRIWGPGDFRPGDGVRFGGSHVYPVTRVNPTTLTVATTPGTTRKAPYLNVDARWRAGAIQTAADLLDQP